MNLRILTKPLVLLLMGLMLAVTITPAYASTTCIGLSATTGDDLVICTGTFPRFSPGPIELLDGNDNFINSGAIPVVRGGNGDDLITNTGEASGMAGGANSDIITNYGNASGSIDGDSGNDIIANLGNNFVSGQSFGINAGDGNDTIYQNNRSSFTNGQGGNDTIILGPGAIGHNNILGGGGTDVLCFNMPGAQAVVNPAQLNGSVTINGQTFGYGEFEWITFNCAVPALTPPPNTNLIYNGNFNLGLEGFGFWNTITNVVGGRLELTRWQGTPNGGMFQFAAYRAPVNGTFQLTFNMGNRSAVTKAINMLVRAPDWSIQRYCIFEVPPAGGIMNYQMRFITSSAMSPMVFQIWLEPGDSAQALLLDNLNLQYIPGAQVPPGIPDDPPVPGRERAECSFAPPVSTNLITNGDFSQGAFGWGTWSANAQFTLNQLDIAANSGAPEGGFFQFVPFGVQSGRGILEYSLRMGNTSSLPKNVNLLVRDPEWAYARSCRYTLPAFAPIFPYTLRVAPIDIPETTGPDNWLLTVLQVWLTPGDGSVGVRFDDLSLIYRTDIVPPASGVSCPVAYFGEDSAPQAAPPNPLALPEPQGGIAAVEAAPAVPMVEEAKP